MIINKNWDLDIAFEVINDRYYPGGLQSGPQRNRQIETWGQLVGRTKEGANKRGNSSRLTQSFHFFMFEPIFSPVNALNQPI
ncbi:hypothetical protein ACK3ZK_18195 [Aeromonas caviae]